MTDLSYQELAHTQFNHALTLFRDTYGPYVVQAMRKYFGTQFAVHMNSLHANGQGAVFIDYDAQRNIVLDVNAIIYLLMEDGGLRQIADGYVPKLFLCENRNQVVEKLPNVLVLPFRKELRELRDTRNIWAHQRTVPIERYGAMTEVIIICIKRLPEPFYTRLTIMQLQFIKAQLRVYQTQSEITTHIETQQQHAQAQQSTAIQDIQQKIDTVVPQLDTALTTITNQKIPQLYDQITQIQQDQSSLLTGIFGALSDTKQETSAQIATLHADIQKLHEANNIRDMAMQQLGTVHESMMLHDAHIAELTQQLAVINQQLAGMHQQLIDAHQQIVALQRTSADTGRQLTDHLRDAHVVSPLPAPTSHHWRWVVVLLLLLLVIGGVGALIWLGYVPRLN
jgi:hypothetical protein